MGLAPVRSHAQWLHSRASSQALYVPLDSWIYPAFDRLAAWGYAPSGFTGMRPWTRSECARILALSKEKIAREDAARPEVLRLYRALQEEFGKRGEQEWDFSIDSVYARSLGILGPPLRHGYHFGQSVVNDYGRPYAEGANASAGGSVRARSGPVTFYMRGELQHWPSSPADSRAVLAATALADQRPVRNRGHFGADRFRLLDTYTSVSLGDTQISFGKQSLWMGPGQGSPLLFSNNAEPIWMLQINRISPWPVPGLVRILGPLRWQFFLGQLSGHEFIFSSPQLYGPEIKPQPFIHGGKISFHPAADLEFGMGVTTIFGGPGMPFTWHNFLRTFSFAIRNAGTAADAGDRRSSFDVSYRVPGLRDWLTVYHEALVEDEISPIGSSRPSLRAGMYLARIPAIPKLDLRLEGVYSDVPGQVPGGPIYYNARYRSGYTNNGNLLGSWIGRQGRGWQGWTTYWFAARNRLQWSYRHMEVDRAFLRGGRLNDFALQAEAQVRPEVMLSAFVQYERWGFPLLQPNPRSDVVISVQLTFIPKQ